MQLQNKLATVGESRYQTALTSPQILSLPKKEAIGGIIDAISKTYYDTGQTIPGATSEEQGANLTCLAVTMHEDIGYYYKTLKIGELKLAFRNGSRGEYGEFYGINVVTLNKWVKAFKNESTVVEARRKAAEGDSAVKTPSKAVIDEAHYLWKETVREHFARFKETGVLLVPFPSHVFQYLSDKGFINLSKEQESEYRGKAVQSVLKNKRVKLLNPRSMAERMELKKSGERISAGELSNEDKAELKAEARKLALVDYFKTIEKIIL